MRHMADSDAVRPIGCTQATEIIATVGVKLSGVLPRGCDLATVYTAAITAKAAHAREAQVLIDTEAPSGERHELMIASFNRGYRAFQQSYRTCTPAADFAIRRYLAEGAKIAREITARYAN